MSTAKHIKAKGIKGGTSEICRLTGENRDYIERLYKNHRKQFDILLIGCIEVKKNEK